ncbi:huntingtin-interacting protein K [Culicoides brevitarsis]|uniref:huntingtin-interacting protein K n=1 Tax=Culicoides brevitarsis TaxID=469753 RepID=UPI00307C0B30
MADTNGDEQHHEEEEQTDKKQKRHDLTGAKDLDKVTDYAEELELKSDISNAANIFAEKRNKEDELKLAKERELQKIHVKKEDVELIMHEMEISRYQAEKTLREHSGNVVNALVALVE